MSLGEKRLPTTDVMKLMFNNYVNTKIPAHFKAFHYLKNTSPMTDFICNLMQHLLSLRVHGESYVIVG